MFAVPSVHSLRPGSRLFRRRKETRFVIIQDFSKSYAEVVFNEADAEDWNGSRKRRKADQSSSGKICPELVRSQRQNRGSPKFPKAACQDPGFLLISP